MLQPDSWEQLAVLFASCVISLLSWKKKIEHYSGDLNSRQMNIQHHRVRFSDGKIKIGIQIDPFHFDLVIIYQFNTGLRVRIEDHQAAVSIFSSVGQ